MGFLPWERWLPPYIYGPLLSVASICILTLRTQIQWWEWIVCPMSFGLGIYCTWIWFKTGKSIFVYDNDELEAQKKLSVTRKEAGSID